MHYLLAGKSPPGSRTSPGSNPALKGFSPKTISPSDDVSASWKFNG